MSDQAEFVVVEQATGRRGALVRTPGYTQGGGYVQPGWRIVWDDAVLEDDPWDGE